MKWGHWLAVELMETRIAFDQNLVELNNACFKKSHFYLEKNFTEKTIKWQIPLLMAEITVK